jgi:hypothetical protein
LSKVEPAVREAQEGKLLNRRNKAIWLINLLIFPLYLNGNKKLHFAAVNMKKKYYTYAKI